METFYNRLFACMRRPETRDGDWALLDTGPAWDGNASGERFLAFSWEGSARRLLVTVNYASERGQCYVRLPWRDLGGREWILTDLMHPKTRYERAGDDLGGRGLYLDVPAWGYHVFEVAPRT